MGVADVLDTNVAGAVHEGCEYRRLYLLLRVVSSSSSESEVDKSR
jgi:hypothetical protein